MTDTGTGRLFVRFMVNASSPGVTIKGGPGTVIVPPTGPNPHMGTTLPSGIVFINTPACRSNVAAHDVPASAVVKKTRIKTRPFRLFIATRFITDSSFDQGMGTDGCSIIQKVNIPPGKMSLLVSSFSL
jgi:hypothetical protein